MTRRKCPTSVKSQLREEQAGKCLYCGFPTNALIIRNNQFVQLWEEFDHFVPISYGSSNSAENWVLACNVCNGIKADHIFQNVTDAQNVMKAERSRKGYEDAWAYHRRTILGITEEITTDQGESYEAPETDIYDQARNPYEYQEPTLNTSKRERKPYIVPGSRPGSSYDASLYEDADE